MEFNTPVSKGNLFEDMKDRFYEQVKDPDKIHHARIVPARKITLMECDAALDVLDKRTNWNEIKHPLANERLLEAHAAILLALKRLHAAFELVQKSQMNIMEDYD